MANEDHDGDRVGTKHEKAIAEDGPRLYDEAHQPGYGSGLHVDIRAFLAESPRATEYLKRLGTVEQFVLRAYYVLRKSEKQLAELVGLNECRFNQYLDGITRKFCAFVRLIDWTPSDCDRVLVLAGVGWFQARPGQRDKALPGSRILVRTSSVLALYIATGSWLKAAESLSVYYVDCRMAVEAATEVLKKKPSLENELLAAYLESLTKFFDVRNGGYTGRLAEIVNTTVRVQDKTLAFPLDLGTLNSANEDHLFSTRALASQHQSE
jgi:hypothetical protein